MKKINNKRYTTQKGEGSQLASELTETVLTSPTREGIGGMSEMRKASKILDKIEKAKEGEDILFEDAEADYLRNKVVNFRWSYYDRGVHEFTEDVDGMESYEIAELHKNN